MDSIRFSSEPISLDICVVWGTGQDPRAQATYCSNQAPEATLQFKESTLSFSAGQICSNTLQTASNVLKMDPLYIQIIFFLIDTSYPDKCESHFTNEKVTERNLG